MGHINNKIISIWKNSDAVCFDVDCTICVNESFDELAKFVGCYKVVSNLTLKAMRGEMPFHSSLSQRLAIVKPSVSIIKNYLRMHPPIFTPGIRKLISILQDRKVPIYIISGGFEFMIEPVARVLGIPMENVFANKLKFYFNGDYAGFDETQPTCEQDGKAEIVAHLKHLYGYQKLVMIGDGVTDLVASPPADLFIGFGGNVVHEKVKNEAKWFVKNIEELIKELI